MDRLDEIKTQTQKWLDWDRNEKSKSAIQELFDAENWTELGKILLKRLEFGTAGIRGRMGPGFGCMNDMVIIQVTQGLCAYLLKIMPDMKKKGVVVSYDGRHNSKRWAKLTAGVFVRHGVPVYLFTTTTPTPFVPFSIKQLGACAGVMVTASHNPKWDNGYKVYWDNGAQILSPHDKEVQKEILANLEPAEGAFQEPDSDLITDPMDAVFEPYFQVIRNNAYSREMNAGLDSPIVYTAMHGVGTPYVKEAWRVVGFKESRLVIVSEQADPDPEFSTVDFPNPEEGASALNLSVKKADEVGARYILANDPDADRLGVAQKSGEKWRILSGNEIGALLAWWIMKVYKERQPAAEMSNVNLLASTVSSKILAAIAGKEGALFTETLTGFKHMGNISHNLIQDGKTVLFAFEEAIGFMCGTAVLDKDGVSAAAVIGELIAFLNAKDMTLLDQLNSIYLEYGYHCTLNSYYLCYDPATTDRIFSRIRSFNSGQPDSYPEQLGGLKVVDVRDLTTGYHASKPDHLATLPSSRSSHMITFWLENGIVITLRTSGTEPKIKYYTEYCAKPGLPHSEWGGLETELAAVVNSTVQDLLQPETNNLTPKPN